MTPEECVAALRPLSREQKTRFYLELASALTVEGRSIWSDDTLPVDQRLERVKWLNETMHR